MPMACMVVGVWVAVTRPEKPPPVLRREKKRQCHLPEDLLFGPAFSVEPPDMRSAGLHPTSTQLLRSACRSGGEAGANASAHACVSTWNGMCTRKCGTIIIMQDDDDKYWQDVSVRCECLSVAIFCCVIAREEPGMWGQGHIP